MVDAWIVEIVIDTGQRYQSVDLDWRTATTEAEEMRRRGRVVAVTLIQTSTGRCLTRPSCNLLASGAGRGWSTVDSSIERSAMVEAFGA